MGLLDSFLMASGLTPAMTQQQPDPSGTPWNSFPTPQNPGGGAYGNQGPQNIALPSQMASPSIGDLSGASPPISWRDTLDANGNPQHASPLGIHGTLRDILGGIGDAFSVAGGGERNYYNKRQQEMAGDALQGFAQDPQAAIAKLAQINPALAERFYTAQGLQSYRNANLQRLTNNMDFKQANISRGKVADLLATADDASMPSVLKQARAYAQNVGADISDMPPDGASPDEIRAWARGVSMTANQQVKADQADASLDERTGYHNSLVGIGQQNANSNAIKAGAAAANVPINQQRADAATTTANANSQNANTRQGAENYNEQHPTRNRRGGATATPVVPAPAQNGGASYKVQNGHVFKRNAQGGYDFVR